MIFDNLNFLTLAIFAPILVLIGILGFIIPANKSLTSGKPRIGTIQFWRV